MSTPAKEPRFPDGERHHLLGSPNIGPGLVERLERLGFDSIAHLHHAGIDAVVAALSRSSGSPALGNRRRALRRSVQHYLERSAGA